MSRLGVVLALLGGLAVAGGHARAQEAGEAPARRKTPRTKPARKEPLLRGAHAIMAKVCGLSEEQQKKIAELNAARNKALEEWQQANAEKLKAAEARAKAAREAKDAEAGKKAREELSALRKGQDEIVAKSQAEILAVLTDEQKAKWRKYNAVRAVRSRFRGVKFTDEQIAKIEAACGQAEGLDSDDPKARAAALAKLSAQVEKDVLTEQQRLERAMAMIQQIFRKANLTDDQLTAVKAAYVKHMSGVDLADPKARGAATRKLHDHIRSEILTDEQREALGARKRPDRPKKDKPPTKPD